MPSMQADDSPRRPTRWIQRTRRSCCAISRSARAVPSGESSSTKIISQSTPSSAMATRLRSSTTLSVSLKVGTMTESCGISRIQSGAG
jgi:hypothetical protein